MDFSGEVLSFASGIKTISPPKKTFGLLLEVFFVLNLCLLTQSHVMGKDEDARPSNSGRSRSRLNITAKQAFGRSTNGAL